MKTGQVAAAQVQGLLTLDWWLGDQPNPERLAYTPGQAIPTKITAALSAEAPASKECQLVIFLADAQTGNSLSGTIALLLVDGAESFTLSPGDLVEASGQLDPSDLAKAAGIALLLPVYFALALIDIGTQQVAGMRAVLLEGAAPSLWEQFTPLMGVALIGVAMGAMIPMATKMFRRQ